MGCVCEVSSVAAYRAARAGAPLGVRTQHHVVPVESASCRQVGVRVEGARARRHEVLEQDKHKGALSVTVGCFRGHMAEIPLRDRQPDGQNDVGATQADTDQGAVESAVVSVSVIFLSFIPTLQLPPHPAPSKKQGATRSSRCAWARTLSKRLVAQAPTRGTLLCEL